MPDFSGLAKATLRPTIIGTKFSGDVFGHFGPDTTSGLGTELIGQDPVNLLDPKSSSDIVLNADGTSTAKLTWFWSAPLNRMACYVYWGGFSLPSSLAGIVQYLYVSMEITNQANVSPQFPGYIQAVGSPIAWSPWGSLGTGFPVGTTQILASVDISGGWDYANTWLRFEIASSTSTRVTTLNTLTVTNPVLLAYYPTTATLGHSINCNAYDPVTLKNGAFMAPGNGRLIKL